MKCKECSGMGKISDCDVEGMWIEECKNCHGSGYICTRIADSLNDKALLADVNVGDWVEFLDAGDRESQGKYLSKAYDNAILVLHIPSNMRCVVPTTKITRKLSPSEVRVKITMEGTVRYCVSFDFDGTKHDAIKMFNSDGKCIAIIHLDAIDAKDRELVKSLLKAQEEI